MPTLRASSMEAEPEVNFNAPVSNENAPGIINDIVDILMQVEPRQRKTMSRNDINTKVISTLEAINNLPDGTPSGLTRDDITPSGVIKTDRINYIVRNFHNYSKTDLRGVVSIVRSLCLEAIKDGGILNSGDDVRIRRALTIVEELLRELDILKYNINQHIRMSAAAPEPANSPAAANVNYPDEFYEENPSNFQDGHLRVNFKKEGLEAPGNRRVYANTVIGTRRTRIYGTNAANIKKKYDARTRKLKAAANRAATEAKAAANAVEQARKKSLEAEAAKKAVELAGKKAREEAARQAKEAAQAQNAQRKAEAAVAAANKKTAEAAAAAAAKAERAAKIASGEIKPSFFNKFRGGRRTRRKTRGSRKSRRGGRK
jgi:chemotaxis protein histidine kinase CheA